MKTLKLVLEEDFSRKTKNELIEMLTALEKALSPSVYERISGISPSELKEVNKKEILEIIENFKKAYEPSWESALANLSADVMKMIFGQMAEDDKPFVIAGASDADFAAELGSIDFATIIGGPLDACVKAQSNASISTVSFINEVGFETDTTSGTKKLRMAEFMYKKNVPNPDFDSSQPVSTSNPKTI